MKSLVVLLSLAVLCAAQPQRPKPPETFNATYEIERHTNVTIFGSGFLVRDADKGMAVENSTYQNQEMEYVLQRYDQKMEYFITNYEEDRCRFRKVQGELPKFWAFLELANYTGQIVVRHVTCDVWEFYAAGVRFSLAVSTTEPDVPVLLQRDVAQNLVVFSFRYFKAGESDPKVFDVPPQCKP